MNIVDSSGWLEYFADGPNAGFFAPSIENLGELIVPSISLLEVFKRVLQQKGENEAIQAIALMMEGMVVDLDSDIAVLAATISLEEKLPLADSVMLATARRHSALLWTQDSDFKSKKGVRYTPKLH